MTRFRIYGSGGRLAHPASGRAGFVDGDVKALLEATDCTTGVVFDGERELVRYLFLARDDESNEWQRYVAEYRRTDAEGQDEACSLLGGLTWNLDSLAAAQAWTLHPRDRQWLDELEATGPGAPTLDAARADLLERASAATAEPLAFGMSSPMRAVGTANALAANGQCAAVLDRASAATGGVDVVLEPRHTADFTPLTDETERLWEWKQTAAPRDSRAIPDEPRLGAADGGGHQAREPVRTAADVDGSAVARETATAVSQWVRDLPVSRDASLGAVALIGLLALVAGLSLQAGVSVGLLGSPGSTDAGVPSGASGDWVTLDAAVNGSAITATGQTGADSVRIALRSADNETVASHSANAALDGSYRAVLSPEHDGEYVVVATANGARVEERVTVAERAPVALDEPAANETVAVDGLTVAGRADAGRISVRLVDDRGETALDTGAVVRDGRFSTRISGLAPGRYRVVVTAGEQSVDRWIEVGTSP